MRTTYTNFTDIKLELGNYSELTNKSCLTRSTSERRHPYLPLVTGIHIIRDIREKSPS